MANNALTIIQGDIESVRDRFVSMAGNPQTFEREAGFAIQILTASDYAMDIAARNRQSVINAVTNVAAIGVSLNPAKKQAYLVPRDGRICLDISYMGLLDIAIQSGSLLWGQAELVRERDSFELHGFDKPPTHGRNPFSKDRGEIVGVYVVVKTRDGDYLTTCMSIEEVNEIRDRSSAWKAWISKKKSCPWVTDEGEMVKKTVIKRAYKTWPKTDRLDQAVHYLNTDGGEGLADIEPQQTQEGGPKMPGRIKPTDGAMESLSLEVQNYLQELAGEVDAIFRDPELGVSHAFDRIAVEQMDDDPTVKVALWSLLKSDVRSALKKEGDARRKAKAETKTEEE